MTARCLLFAALMPLVMSIAAVAQTEPPTRLSYKSAFARETVDQAWSIRLVGSVPSLPGCFLIVHDASGKQLVRRVIPHGEYPPDKALKMEFPADGSAGEYRIVLVGFENDLMSLQLPLTDLPLEVYGGDHFAAAATSRLFFRAPAGKTSMPVASYGGSLRVFENDKEVLDTKRDGKLERYDWRAELPLKADAVYRLEPYACRYFRAHEGIHLAVDPAHWFVPDPKLEEFKWWQLPAP